MKILLATKNRNKFNEISKILLETGNFHQAVFKDNLIDVDEDGNTILENAKKKAFEVYEEYKIPVISDDSGLFVDSLDGLPGLRSKRYAGGNASDQENIDKLLKNLNKENDNSAYFKTVLYFYDGKNEITTEGTLVGRITHMQRGKNGFGYDSIFIPDNKTKTFGQMSKSKKIKMDHRFIAFKKLKKKVRTL